MKFPEHPVARAALALPSLLYAGAVRIRNRYYDRPGRSRSAGLPVIAVGNLTVGGTGKTPVVQWLCRRLLGEGETPAVVTRGYGGTAGAGPLVVSRGRGPLTTADHCGDEPYLLAESLEQVPVIAGSNRTAGARAAGRLGATVVVLDDGFQHRRLHRDLDILLLDRNAPEGNGRLLPAGPLREHPTEIRRAGVVLLTRTEPGDDTSPVETWVRRFNPVAPILTAQHAPAGFSDRDGNLQPTPAAVVGFCGIARPDSFRRSLELAGVRVAAFRSFEDHHRYSEGDLAELSAASAAAGAPLVTTPKDLARLSHRNDPLARKLLALGLDLVIDDPERLMAAVRCAIASGDPV